MVDLSRKQNREINHPFDALVVQYDKILEEASMFRYLQFFTHIATDGKRWIETITLNSFDHGKKWWKKKIEKEYNSVHWLHDSYKNTKEAWEAEQRYRMLNPRMTVLNKM